MIKRMLAWVTRVSLARRWLVLIGASVGLVFFVIFYGVAMINPTHTAWLVSGGDLTQHYLGWEFYRQSSWQFPLGGIADLAYPHPMSVVFMDALPIFAIPAKIIYSIFGIDFQYFGLWGILSFMLQGALAAFIVSRWSKNPFVTLFAAILVTLSPVMLGRVFAHTALAGQWIILAAIAAALELKGKSLRIATITWSGLAVLSVAIHPYLAVGVIAIFAMWLVMQQRSARSLTILASLVGLATLVTFWIIGGFMVQSIGGGELGEYGLTLNALFDPADWSSLLRSFGTNFEGMGYAGMGVLLVMIAAGWIVICTRRCMVRTLTVRHLIVFAFICVLIILAIGPVVRVGHIELFSYPVPAVIEKIWSVFRATGRLFWPVYYLGVVACLYIIIRRQSRLALATLAIAAMMQVVDVAFSPAQTARSLAIREQTTHPLDRRPSDEWSAYMKGKSSHRVSGNLSKPEEFRYVGMIALKYKTTLNTGYFARAPGAAIEATIQQAKQQLLAGQAEPATVYMTRDRSIVDEMRMKGTYTFHYIDSVWVIVP